MKIRRVLLLAFTAVALAALSGCIGGSSTTTPPPVDEAAVKAAVGAVIADFEGAVEAYNVDGMMSCLSGSGFKLTLQEAGLPYQKTLATLESELRADETDQLDWRKPVGAGGHAYQLDLELGTQVFSNITATGAIVRQDFTVYESADGIPELKTDNGTITWQFAKISGAWKATAMTIAFDPVQVAPRVQALERKAFGFGRSPEGLAG